jgi:hypothetical protein
MGVPAILEAWVILDALVKEDYSDDFGGEAAHTLPRESARPMHTLSVMRVGPTLSEISLPFVVHLSCGQPLLNYA